MSGDPEDFEEMVDFDYTKALLTVQYQAGNTNAMNNIIDTINALTKDDPHMSLMGGYSLIDKAICESVVTGQYNSLLFAFVIILILLAVIFRSIVAGLLGSLPLAFSVLCTFGIMGWIGIELNIVTALLSSVSIGLGVDFTIQMFWKLKTEIANGHSYASSVHIALKTMGRGISINAFSVMLGFSVLFLSAFPIIRSFGFLIIISLFFCLICALVLIPALCMLIKPRFLGSDQIEPVPVTDVSGLPEISARAEQKTGKNEKILAENQHEMSSENKSF
jgi:predicted RND superfamily exporter protein